jgi:hypothetical protein
MGQQLVSVDTVGIAQFFDSFEEGNRVPLAVERHSPVLHSHRPG